MKRFGKNMARLPWQNAGPACIYAKHDSVAFGFLLVVPPWFL